MNVMQKAKIVLVCTDCDNTRILYHGIKDEISISNIIVEQPVSKKILIKRRIKRQGLIKVFGQLVFQAGIVPVMRKLSRSRVKAILSERKLSIDPMPADKTIHVASVNEPSFLAAIEKIKPDLILVNGTRIISAATLNKLTCPIINVHVGITPDYRGVHGAYWALASDDADNCGVTVHLIDKGIDTGAVLARARISITKDDNFITYPYLQFEQAIGLVKKVVPELLGKTHSFLPTSSGKSKLWYHPTVWQYIANRFKGVK